MEKERRQKPGFSLELDTALISSPREVAQSSWYHQGQGNGLQLSHGCHSGNERGGKKQGLSAAPSAEESGELNGDEEEEAVGDDSKGIG